MHRPAFATAIAFFLAQKFAEHLFEICAFSDAVAVAAVGRGDFIGSFESLANTHRYGFFAGVHMRQARHFGRQIKLVGLVFEGADANHLAVHAQIIFAVGFLFRGAHRACPWQKVPDLSGSGIRG